MDGLAPLGVGIAQRRPGTFIGIALGLVLTSAARRAGAVEVEVTAHADGQWYGVSSPWSDFQIARRRYTHTLGLSVYRIGVDERSGSELFFRSRLRLDADFGQNSAERDPRSDPTFVAGLDEAPLDVMYAYLEGTKLAGGWFGFRVGRQYVSDALGWWSFDGAEVSLTTPVYLRFEAYTGFEQRGLVPLLGTRRFEAGGVWRGDRSDLEVGQSPDFIEEKRLAPAIGFALESAGTHWLHSRLTYRRVLNRDVVYLSQYPDLRYGLPQQGVNLGRGWDVLRGARISSERIGYAVRADAASLGGVHGRVVYDLYTDRWTQYGAGLDWYATERLTLGADYDYVEPSFDGDSIFNWFDNSGIETLLGRGQLAVNPRLVLAASAGIKVFRTRGNPERYAGLDTSDPAVIAQALVTPIDASQSAIFVEPLATANGTYAWSDGDARVGVTGEAGDSGHTAGVDATVRQRFSEGFYDTLATVSLYDWSDSLRPTRDATSLTYVLGGGISPLGALTSTGRIGLQWEHTINRLVGQRFRILCTLDLKVLR